MIRSCFLEQAGWNVKYPTECKILGNQRKRPPQNSRQDFKMNLNSDAKEAKALETSAITIESYDSATTSNTNRTLEDYKANDSLSDVEEDNGDEGNKEEERRAPIELMGEFLKAIMDHDYKLSSKLCQMILLYEPENSEAKQFEVLLEKKLQLDEAASTGQNDVEDSTESDSSDEDDSEDSDNEDSDEDERSDEEFIGSPESE
ncbi:glutamate-rich protein 2 isoform X2 [Hypanus sabinus]|uniref:glutamate-rich protein 2 isoform X2 n=1 Tax=Hypanus sabinus TaxID=79690 RepID=UPI0028C3AC6C|nr:glutamate-rich protein 2 isoform X2 [Hypanus sabinus]